MEVKTSGITAALPRSEHLSLPVSWTALVRQLIGEVDDYRGLNSAARDDDPSLSGKGDT